MKMFMLLTFGFLTFAFYEMSGGADFEPASARMATQADNVEPVAKSSVAPEPVQAAAITKIESSPPVARVALSLTRTQDTTPSEPQAQEPAASAQTEPVSATPSQAVVTQSTDTPQIMLPSLIVATDTPAEPTITDTNSDIRTVSGNRVNVRGGPSTDYGIVSKLTRGEEVKVLEDNGDGWVLMEPVGGGEAGWMADFLLTSG